MYMNKWTLDFNPEIDVPSTISVWACIPHLPLICWDNEPLKSIENAIGKYIDQLKPKGCMFACAGICVEVNLEKGFGKSH